MRVLLASLVSALLFAPAALAHKPLSLGKPDATGYQAANNRVYKCKYWVYGKTLKTPQGGKTVYTKSAPYEIIQECVVDTRVGATLGAR